VLPIFLRIDRPRRFPLFFSSPSFFFVDGVPLVCTSRKTLISPTYVRFTSACFTFPFFPHPLPPTPFFPPRPWAIAQKRPIQLTGTLSGFLYFSLFFIWRSFPVLCHRLFFGLPSFTLVVCLVLRLLARRAVLRAIFPLCVGSLFAPPPMYEILVQPGRRLALFWNDRFPLFFLHAVNLPLS